MSPQDHRTTVGFILRSQFKLHVSIDEGFTLTNLEVNVSVPCSASWIFPITLSKTVRCDEKILIETAWKSFLRWCYFALMSFCVLYLILVLKELTQCTYYISTHITKHHILLIPKPLNSSWFCLSGPHLSSWTWIHFLANHSYRCLHDQGGIHEIFLYLKKQNCILHKHYWANVNVIYNFLKKPHELTHLLWWRINKLTPGFNDEKSSS